MSSPEEQVKATFDRLRAQLCGIIEALNLSKEQETATKRMVKDRTSEAWNKISSTVDEITNTK